MSRLFYILTVILISAGAILAQTSAFTFQGKLNDGANAANGTYQFQFKLYDANGVQVGETLSDIPATVTNGIFAVNLDFGAAAFNGSPRSIEIGVRENCPSPCAFAYTLLNPRQSIASTPYAIKSLKASEAANALYLDGIPGAQFVQTGDARLSDSRMPMAGSNSYIQNTLFTQTANFTVSGNGVVGGFLRGSTINAIDQFQINGTRVFFVPSNLSIAVGGNAGNVTTGAGNSFFGTNSGKANTTGTNNTFLGADSGSTFTTGSQNVAAGFNAGRNGGSGASNTFVGAQSGFTSASNGFGNTAVGFSAAVAPNVANATAIGAGALATASSMVALGGGDSEVLIRGELEVDKDSVFDGKITVNALGSAGNTPLCRNGLGEISSCSGAFAGQVENQQELNQSLQERIKQQQREIDALKALVCSQNPTAAVCAAPKEK